MSNSNSNSNNHKHKSCVKCLLPFIAEDAPHGQVQRSSVSDTADYCTSCHYSVVVRSHLSFLTQWVHDPSKVVPLQFIELDELSASMRPTVDGAPLYGLNIMAVLRCIETNINERLSELFGTVPSNPEDRHLPPLQSDYRNWNERIQGFNLPYRLDRFRRDSEACRKLLKEITNEIYLEAVPQFLTGLYLTERGKILYGNIGFYEVQDQYRYSSETRYNLNKDTAVGDGCRTERRWWVRQLFLKTSVSYDYGKGMMLNLRYAAEMVPLNEHRSAINPAHAYTIGDVFDELLNKVY